MSIIGDERCDDPDCEAMQIAASAYTVIQPTHDFAHYMNERPCSVCGHGQRYHEPDGECQAPGCRNCEGYE